MAKMSSYAANLHMLYAGVAESCKTGCMGDLQMGLPCAAGVVDQQGPGTPTASNNTPHMPIFALACYCSFLETVDISLWHEQAGMDIYMQVSLTGPSMCCPPCWQQCQHAGLHYRPDQFPYAMSLSCML